MRNLVVSLLLAVTTSALAKDPAKVEVFIPSLDESWVKVIPSGSQQIVQPIGGKTLAVNCTDKNGITRIFNAANGTELHSIKPRGVRPYADALAYSPDGSRLVTAHYHSNRAEFRVWNTSTARQDKQWIVRGKHVGRIGFADNDRFVMHAASGIVEWAISTGEMTFEESEPDRKGAQFAETSNLVRTGKRVEFAAIDGDNPHLRIFDFATHREVGRAELGDRNSFSCSAIALSPTGDRLAAVGTGLPPGATTSYEVRLWNSRTGQLIWKQRPSSNYPSHLAFSPDGRYLVTAGMHIPIPNPESVGEPPYGWGRGGYYGQDGRIVWTSFQPSFRSAHNAILLWDTRTGDIKKAILHPDHHITSIAFSVDGTALLITGSENPAQPRKVHGIVARLSLQGAFD